MKLFEFTSEEHHKHDRTGRRKTRVGKRCGNPVPHFELEAYATSGFCGWCLHMYEKLLDE